jgi:ParB-like chromosome segregation protein Spo0J
MQRTWPDDELRALPLEALDERYRRYRLSVPEAERAMAGSLRRYGQMSPVVVCLREERAVLVDGFKRLTAARSLRGLGRCWLGGWSWTSGRPRRRCTP